MNLKIAVVGTAAIVAGTVTACGGGSGPPHVNTGTPPSMSATQSLDTAQVLAQAQVTSETALPYAVDNGALTLTDTSETSDPIGADNP
jgi:hypothetical protein